jgi:hypothetical protein
MNSYAMYSDDSGSSDKRYRCLSVVSGERVTLDSIRSILYNCLSKNAVGEIKFEEVRGHSPKTKVAACFFQTGIEFCTRKKLRMDILLWDHYDSRHTIGSRDDDANMERMYYKVLVHAARQWNKHEWYFYPDEQSGIDWDKLVECTNHTTLQKKNINPSLFPTKNILLEIEKPVPTSSSKEPLIQLADLFSGISRYSREKGTQYLNWLNTTEAKENPGLFLFEENINSDSSKADLIRFSLLRDFDRSCKKNSLGVSIKEKNYLWTPKPNAPVNFWSYAPQGDYDKAPTNK